jgi:hypothetical protein
VGWEEGKGGRRIGGGEERDVRATQPEETLPQ